MLTCLDKSGVKEHQLFAARLALEEAIANGDSAGTRRATTWLEKVLRPSPLYKQSLRDLQTPVAGGITPTASALSTKLSSAAFICACAVE